MIQPGFYYSSSYCTSFPLPPLDCQDREAESGDETNCAYQARDLWLRDVSNSPIWDPRIKKLLTKWQQHQESQRVLKDCLQLLGGILIAVKDPGSLSSEHRVERLGEQSRKSLWLWGK
jgi:hypothetical protein